MLSKCFNDILLNLFVCNFFLLFFFWKQYILSVCALFLSLSLTLYYNKTGLFVILEIVDNIYDKWELFCRSSLPNHHSSVPTAPMPSPPLPPSPLYTTHSKHLIIVSPCHRNQITSHPNSSSNNANINHQYTQHTDIVFCVIYEMKSN